MTNGQINATPVGKTVYLDANVIIRLIQYAIAERDRVLSKWPPKTLKPMKAIYRLVEAGALQMRGARAGEVAEDGGPRFHASILALVQAAHALQLYGVMAKRTRDQVPYRELTTFWNVDNEILPGDLAIADDKLSFFVDKWLANKNLKSAIVLHPMVGGDIDLSVCFPLAREFSRHAYLDSEDALHLATAVAAKCAHFATTDVPLRRALDRLCKSRVCKKRLLEMDRDWRMPKSIDPTNENALIELAWHQ